MFISAYGCTLNKNNVTTSFLGFQGNRQLLASVLSFNHIPAPPSRPLSGLPSNPLKIFKALMDLL